MLSGIILSPTSESSLWQSELERERRLHCVVVTSERELIRKVQKTHFDFLGLFSQDSEKTFSTLRNLNVLAKTTLVFAATFPQNSASSSSAASSPAGIFRCISNPVLYRSLWNTILTDYEILMSALDRKDHITRGKIFDDPRVGFICASTGGPKIVSKLAAELQLKDESICLLQHMGTEFVDSFYKRLSKDAKSPVVLIDGEVDLNPGSIYMPRGGCHLLVLRDGHQLRLRAVDIPISDGYTPSINLTLFSAASHLQNQARVLVLSGMGDDGAAGALAISKRGGHILTQNPLLAAAPSMPNATLQLSGCKYVELDQHLLTQFMGGLRNGQITKTA